jgi:hypothetical protein
MSTAGRELDLEGVFGILKIPNELKRWGNFNQARVFVSIQTAES